MKRRPALILQLMLALEGCAELLEEMNSIAESLVPGFSSSSKLKRKWVAIETVRQRDKISQFRAKLGDAKLSLMMAQQNSAAYVSSICPSVLRVRDADDSCSCTSHLNFQIQQQSLTVLTKTIAELCEERSYQSEKIVFSGGDQEGILHALSSKVKRVVASLPIGPLRGVVERELWRAYQRNNPNLLSPWLLKAVHTAS